MTTPSRFGTQNSSGGSAAAYACLGRLLNFAFDLYPRIASTMSQQQTALPGLLRHSVLCMCTCVLPTVFVKKRYPNRHPKDSIILTSNSAHVRSCAKRCTEVQCRPPKPIQLLVLTMYGSAISSCQQCWFFWLHSVRSWMLM